MCETVGPAATGCGGRSVGGGAGGRRRTASPAPIRAGMVVLAGGRHGLGDDGPNTTEGGRTWRVHGGEADRAGADGTSDKDPGGRSGSLDLGTPGLDELREREFAAPGPRRPPLLRLHRRRSRRRGSAAGTFRAALCAHTREPALAQPDQYAVDPTPGGHEGPGSGLLRSPTSTSACSPSTPRVL